MPGLRLEGKVAMVTGGGSGFGAGIVRKCVEEGARVFIWDINEEPAYQLCKELGEVGGIPRVFIGDVSKLEDWERALEQCIGIFGTLDILVNNAGVVHVAKPSYEVEEEEVDRMFRINVKPLYYSAKTVVKWWIGKGIHGSVVNISSISAPRPRPRVVWYAASKGAVTTAKATRGLAAEFAPHHIRYNCIQPVLGETAMVAPVLGGVDTPEARVVPLAGIPLGRLTTPEDIGKAVVWLAGEEAGFCTGVCLDVDGGRSLM